MSKVFTVCADPIGMNQANKNIKLDDLLFYFDGVESDRQDQGGLGRKTAQILALRERLLKLPDHEFDAVIRTIQNMVETPKSSDTGDDRDRLAKQQEANTLFSAVNESHAAQKSVEQVDKV